MEVETGGNNGIRESKTAMSGRMIRHLSHICMRVDVCAPGEVRKADILQGTLHRVLTGTDLWDNSLHKRPPVLLAFQQTRVSRLWKIYRGGGERFDPIDPATHISINPGVADGCVTNKTTQITAFSNHLKMNVKLGVEEELGTRNLRRVCYKNGFGSFGEVTEFQPKPTLIAKVSNNILKESNYSGIVSIPCRNILRVTLLAQSNERQHNNCISIHDQRIALCYTIAGQEAKRLTKLNSDEENCLMSITVEEKTTTYDPFMSCHPEQADAAQLVESVPFIN